uniref:patatin-like phospholipase family protein n=1 Tax=Escherichia coli TaxID=562 RepID=UPI00201AD771
FAAVATNLSTGRELWFTEGDLHLAIRASCSMPGLMSPVRHNGYWLVDGTEIERCERRFAAVATNLSTGRELWFTEGDLHLAIRASCSMPG